MIVSREMFVDVVAKLETASQETLELTRAFVRWIDNSSTGSETHDLISVLDHLVGINASLTALEQLLRVILETDEQGYNPPRT